MLERVSIPASVMPVRFPIVGFARDDGIVRVYKEQDQILPLGAYIAKIELLTGDKIHKAKHNFIVQDKFPFAVWVNS